MEPVISLIFAVLGLVAVTGELTLSSLLLSLYNFLVAWMYLNHRSGKNKAAWWEMALALAGTFLPLAAFRPAPMADAGGFIDEVGMFVQLWGMLGMIWSVFSLSTSLGIAPVDRGLVTDGSYRRVRHPLYAFEIIFCLGYWLGNLTWWNGAVLVLLTGIQVARALREEKVIEGYGEYATHVRWRFIPGVF